MIPYIHQITQGFGHCSFVDCFLVPPPGPPRWERCRELLQDAPELVALRGRSGATALVQALRQADVFQDPWDWYF